MPLCVRRCFSAQGIQIYRDGFLAEQRGDYDKAEQSYRKALENEPGFEYASVALASLLQAKVHKDLNI
jgi:tetratricopeptide (TPR) repeat protein